jgi:hypothetical protein
LHLGLVQHLIRPQAIRSKLAAVFAPNHIREIIRLNSQRLQSGKELT